VHAQQLCGEGHSVARIPQTYAEHAVTAAVYVVIDYKVTFGAASKLRKAVFRLQALNCKTVPCRKVDLVSPLCWSRCGNSFCQLHADLCA
jgi:hypothetical protein